MADKEKNVVLNFKMDGQVEYAKTIRDINAIMNAAASEYKTHIAAMEKDADATKKLAAEKQKLEIQMEAAKKRTEMLRAEYEAMAKDTKTTTGQLAAKHNQLMKSERAEIALSDALERVNDGLTDQAEEARKVEEQMNLLETQSDRLETQTERLNAEYELQKAQLGDNADEGEKLALKMAHLNDVHDVAQDKVENLEQQLELAKQQYGENSDEVDRYEIQLLEARTAEQQLANDIHATNIKLNEQVDKLAKTSKTLQDLGGKLKDLGSDMSDIGKNMSLKVTAPVVALAGSLVKTGIEYKAFKEEAKQAFTVLLGSAEAAEKHMDRIMDFAKTTPFAFPDLVSANRKLVSFGMAAEDTEPVMEAIANAVAAMGGGANEIDTLSDVFAKIQSNGKITGEELNRLSDQGVNALAILANQSGVSMDEMRKQISKGAIDSEKAISGLVDGMMNGTDGVAGETAKLGGSLDALSGTWKGAIDSMKGAWRRAGDAIVSDDMFSKMTESVGKITEIINKLPDILGPVADTLGTMMMGLIDNISALADWFLNLDPVFQQMVIKLGLIAVAAGPLLLVLGKTITVVGSMITTVGKLVGFFGKLLPILKTVGVFIGGISLPVWGVIAAIAALIAIGVLLYKNWDTIKEKAIEIWGYIADWFVETWESIKEGIMTAWNAITDLFTAAWETIKEIFNTVLESIMEVVSGYWESMSEGINQVWEGIMQFFEGVWELIKNIFAGALLLLINLVTGNFDELKENAIAIFNNIKDALAKIWDGIKNVFSGAVSAIVGFVKHYWDNIKNVTSTIFNGVKTLISTIWNGIKSFFTETLVNIWNSIKEKFNDIKTSISEKMGDAKQSIIDIWDNVMNFFSDIDLKQIGKDIINGLISGITSKVEAVKDAVKSVTSAITGKIKSILNIQSPSRVMMEIGKFITEGLGIGIDKMKNYAVNKTANVANAITGVMKDGIEIPDMEISTVVRQPSNFGATSVGFGGSTMNEYNYQTLNMEGLFNGAVFNVRDDQDIPKLAKQLDDYIRLGARRNGVVMP